MASEGIPASPAEGYQVYFGPSIFGPLSDRVLDLGAPSPGEAILEVASGTGILTRKLAAIAGSSGRVLGIDLNPKMIEVAQGLHSEGAPIEYRQGDGAALDLPDAGFDAVYCQQGLQFFPDRAAGAREMRRVLNPGGRAVVITWKDLDAHPLFAALVEAEEPHLAAIGADVSREDLVAPFSLGDGNELAALLRDAGFGDVQVHDASIKVRFSEADRFVERMEFAYAAVIPQFAADSAAFAVYLEAINKETQDIVGEYRQGDEIVFPMHANVAIASTR